MCLLLFEIPEGMEKFVQDYKIIVFDITFLLNDTINKLKSTFKHVAHFFKYRRYMNRFLKIKDNNYIIAKNGLTSINRIVKN